MSKEEEEEYPYDKYSSEESDHKNDDDDNLLPSDLSVQEQLGLVQDTFEQNDDTEKAESLLKKIQPNDKQTNYSFYILHALISLKNNRFDECVEYAKKASIEQKGELLPYKIQIYSYMNRKIELLAPVLHLMFKNTKPDLETMILISNKLQKLVKQNIDFADLYYNAIDEDSSLLPAVHYIIPSENTLDLRLRILYKNSKTNTDACSLLIKTLIKEKKEIDKARSHLGNLPEDHPTRLLFKILFGAHPYENAKLLCSQAGNDQHFKDFIKFYEEKNLLSLQRFIQNEPFFASGWILLSELTDKRALKILALKKANQIYPQKEIMRKLEELDATMVIQDNKGEDVVINASPKDENDFKECKKIFELYEKTKNKEDLKPILNIENNFLNARLKIQSILELEPEIGEEETMTQLEMIKETKYKKIYNIIGHIHLKKGNIEEAIKNFVEDATLGSNDPVCLEIASKKLIQEEKIEEALKFCLKAPDYEWAIFRSGLIYQRLGNHNEAVKMFYKIIRNRQSLTTENDNENNDDFVSNRITVDSTISIESVWKVVAQSYAALNRYMALKDVLSTLRELGSPDLDYESLYKTFHEISFYSNVNYDIETSPLQFHNFLTQILTDIKMLKWQGRSEACVQVINKYKDLVLQFMEKWGNLGAILKSAGDFFLEGFILSQNKDQEMFSLALKAYKKRAEVDLVPESLVDVSNVLHVIGKDDQALTVLKKALTKYPNSQLIWMNIGVLFALQEKFSFARHCFIVASKISYDSQNGKVFTYIAAVEKFLNDFTTMEKAIRAAEEMNLTDVSLLQIKSMNGIIGQLDASLSIFDGELVSPDLPRLCIKKRKFIEALGFALMLNNNQEIALAYEALGNYEMALQFTNDEEQKSRLLTLLGKDKFENSIVDEGIENAIKRFNEENDLISKLTAAALCISKNDKIEACKILRSLIESGRARKNRKQKKESNVENAQNNNNENASTENNNNDNENTENNNNNENTSTENNNENENAGNNNENTENNNNNESTENNNENESTENNNNNESTENNYENESAENNNNESTENNNNENEDSNHIKITRRYLKLILSWLLQYEQPGEKEIYHPIIDEDPLLYYLSMRRSESESKAAVKTYHKFMNTNPYGVRLFLCLALKDKSKDINLAKITAAAENLYRELPSRESCKLLIAAYIKAKKFKEALTEIQKLLILDPDEIPRTVELIKQIKSLSK